MSISHAGIYKCDIREAGEKKFQSSAEDSEVEQLVVVTEVVPRFQQAPLSYVQLESLDDAYIQLEIELSFKPEKANGLIFYSGGQNGDFVSFGLRQGVPEFRFNVGGSGLSSLAVISAEKPITFGSWHTVRLVRRRGTKKENDDRDVGKAR